MIVDLDRFLAAERPRWEALERILVRLESDPGARLELPEIREFHALHLRASAALADLTALAIEPGVARPLEALVARSYAELHEGRRRPAHARFRALLGWEFPAAVRRHWRAGLVAVLTTVFGAGLGAIAVRADPEVRAVLLPFGHDLLDPADRVKREEEAVDDRLEGRKASFAAYLMANNIRVSFFAFALGATLGLGTWILLFYNGAILGAVCADYLEAGQGVFLAGWLLPHGSVEIPAIVLGGLAGFALAGAMAGDRSRPLAERVRAVTPDLAALLAGIVALLVWAGLIEALFSQYHEPFLPYGLKIAVGLVQFAGLAWWLSRPAAAP